MTLWLPWSRFRHSKYDVDSCHNVSIRTYPCRLFSVGYVDF
jgi:hypothetical protein